MAMVQVMAIAFLVTLYLSLSALGCYVSMLYARLLRVALARVYKINARTGGGLIRLPLRNVLISRILAPISWPIIGFFWLGWSATDRRDMFVRSLFLHVDRLAPHAGISPADARRVKIILNKWRLVYDMRDEFFRRVKDD